LQTIGVSAPALQLGLAESGTVGLPDNDGAPDERYPGTANPVGLRFYPASTSNGGVDVGEFRSLAL
jgi:hypothetical protein